MSWSWLARLWIPRLVRSSVTWSQPNQSRNEQQISFMVIKQPTITNLKSTSVNTLVSKHAKNISTNWIILLMQFLTCIKEYNNTPDYFWNKQSINIRFLLLLPYLLLLLLLHDPSLLSFLPPNPTISTSPSTFNPSPLLFPLPLFFFLPLSPIPPSPRRSRSRLLVICECYYGPKFACLIPRINLPRYE